MFAKTFRVKSNTAIKGSDSQTFLRAGWPTALSGLGQPTWGGDRGDVQPGKGPLPQGIDLLAMSFCVSFWAVYTLWSYPDLLPTFTTWPLVLEKLVGGADLMLPGLVVPPAGLPQVQKGDLCAMALVGNRAPVAIGVAAMSTAEMLTSGLKGRGFSVLHTYRDHLWQSGDKSSPPSMAPLALDPPDLSEEKGSRVCELWDPGMGSLQGEGGEAGVEQGGELTCAAPGILYPSEKYAYLFLAEQMDELLQRCFLHALKCQVKKADLPLLTSTFLGSHMFSCCPAGQQLDIKRSSYKKLSKFLQQMQQEQIIQVEELSRGVESIVAVDWKHPRITSFVIPEPSPTSQTIQEGSREQPYHPPDIKPLYCVPASMTLLFQESGHKKGSALEGGEVRTIIVSYAKKNDLVDADNKNLVKLDPILCDCILEKNEQHTVTTLPWDSLLSRCLERLQPAYQVTFPGQEPIVKKGKICPIDITLAQRASNKKVTVVRNLEAYGLDPCSVAAILQQRCQASTTVTPAPGSKDGLQVQIQGNQVHHLSRLLLEDYQLPRKYIQGLEKAPKPSRKK
uniref:Eukaryotic translation initiation factor 2D n=1 Tax=Ursus maritimus TaxID=29073 RepID=A0A452TCN7_URSMA